MSNHYQQQKIVNWLPTAINFLLPETQHLVLGPFDRSPYSLRQDSVSDPEGRCPLQISTIK
ncbi:hypothetical protein BpHYR1_028267 [Brachionus plicatilis]|uniref:Uncharacterized protein n=1 Tax=Brachionus plicatilis TaxID=10195 RepID=A0A3M7PX94_BRAPC|nr:hypothetical protein BpHYR1_028267 [Brachionus plicatilis]